MTRTFLVLLATSGALVAMQIFPFIHALIMALVFAVLFAPLVSSIQTKVPRLRSFGPLIATLIAASLIYGPLTWFAFTLYGQAADVFYSAQSGDLGFWYDELQAMIQDPNSLLSRGAKGLNFELSYENLELQLRNLSASVASWLSEHASSLLNNFFSFGLNIFVMLLLMYTFLARGALVGEYLMTLSPLPREDEIRLATRFKEIATAVFLGNGTASLLQGLFGGFAISMALGLPAILWGTIIMIFSFMPLVGASGVFFPATFYLIWKQSYGIAAIYFTFNMTYMLIFEYGLKPRLIGNKAAMPAILIFISILGGLQTWGVLGLFYGPLFTTLFLTLVDIYHKRYEKALIPESSLQST